MLLHII